jgi:hypothetical protein
MSGRDELGRFTPGNQVAAGNQGNRNPKWGNRNAVTHGFHEKFDIITVDPDGWLNIKVINGKHVGIRIHPNAYIIDEEGVHIRLDVLDILKGRGIHSKTGRQR